MVEPRQMAQMAYLGEDRYLVIGGRQPFADTRAQYSFAGWSFEDAEASPVYTGPVDVPMSGPGTRRAGKAGHGAQLSAALTATAGAPQTALNAQLLLPNWTIAGWMTRGTGSVISNLNQPWAAQADNAMVHFGVDPDDDLFFIRWQHGAGPTTEIRKTEATATELMEFLADPEVPRYYQFCITKEPDEAQTKFTLYINGRQVGQWTADEPDGGSAGLWSFGRAVTGSVGAYTGVVDEVGISGETLDAGQVWNLYANEVGVAYDSPSDLDYQPVGRVLNTCEVIDTGSGSAPTGSMAVARFASGLCTLPDGRVLVVGGVGYAASEGPRETSQRLNELRSCELYNPLIGNWTRISDTVHPHSSCLAMLDGRRVYVAGGLNSAAVEYLDLDDMTWHLSVEPLPHLRPHAAAGWAGDDVMVVAGGGDPEYSSGSNTHDWPSDPHFDMVGGPSGDRVVAGGLTGLYEVLASDGDTGFTYLTPDHRFYTAAGGFSVMPVRAPDGEFDGPWVFETERGNGLSGTDGTTQDRLLEDHRYPLLRLGSGEGAAFPDEPGYLVIRSGYSDETGPIRYLGNTGDDVLVLDAGFRFPYTIEPGVTVTLLAQRGPYVPEHPERFGAFYVTDSPSGRVTCEKLLFAVSAAGIDLDVDVRYPGDRGLGGEGLPERFARKLSDIVSVFGSNDLDGELERLRDGTE
jgi:hypothetical protein